MSTGTAVHEGGVKFAYIKATEGGDRIDPKFVRNWQRRQGRRPAARRLSFRLLVPAVAGRTWPGSKGTCRPKRTPCRRCSTSRRRRIRRPAGAVSNASRRSHEIRAMLSEMERYYGKKPIVYTTVDFYQSIIDGELDRLSDLDPLDQAAAFREIWRSRMAVLAISIRRLGARHSDQGRSQRLLWRRPGLAEFPGIQWRRAQGVGVEMTQARRLKAPGTGPWSFRSGDRPADRSIPAPRFRN